MLRDSLDALVSGNSALARDVCARDDEIDELNRQTYERLKLCMKRDPESVDTGLALLGISSHIERVADLATNIAEDVVFLVEAADIRHPRLEEPRQVPESW